MKKFSYSRINTYNQCPQKFKIQYLDKVFSDKNSIEAFMGQSVHSVLEKLYSKNNFKNHFISFDHLIGKKIGVIILLLQDLNIIRLKMIKA